ncbi:hypothetical protein NE865_04290 [Phthorimaea operculella]|nr:hypothetical protein NE865_04290 [Phthorimaea operculella]
MWCVLVLCPVLLAAGAQTLSIDTQLGTSNEDCFERISIGEQIPNNAIYRNVSELTTKECEQICKQDKQCQAYDYGVGAKGNATCDLSNISEKDIKEKNVLIRHPDYDVYIRRIQCEQGPPTPLQTALPPLQDEGSGPTHRPVIRPDFDDAKRPLADDFEDSRPFETTGPRPYPQRPYKPSYLNHIDRPDDYNQRPAYDEPPSYGEHRPQDIPFRPERPYANYSDPYDVLQFEGPRPHWRPDPHYPPRPNDEFVNPYGVRPHRPNNVPLYPTEKPEFVYITRPTRKPSRPLDDTGSPGNGNRPNHPYTPDPYGPIPPYKPSRPMDYPYRPNNKPSYDYNSQYASSYGQNQYNDNSIYLEIFDPPRPYKPSRPYNDRPTYGLSGGYGQNYGYGQSSYGGSYANQNSYTQNFGGYGGSSISPLDNYNKPVDTKKPYKPLDDSRPGYGLQDSLKPEKPYDKPSSGYGPLDDDPISHKPQKPVHDSSSGYGSSQSDQSYGSQTSGYGQKPQDPYPKPGYSEKPAYDSQKPSSQGSYGSLDDFTSNQGYGLSQSSYGGSQSNFQDYHSSHQSSYGGGQYGSFLGGYGTRPSRPYNDRPYERPPFDEGPSYNKPLSDRPSYGNSPSYDEGPSYNKPINDRPSYGNRPPLDEGPSYYKPSNDRPSYGGRPPLDEGPSYTKPINDRPSYGSKPSYNDKPLYDTGYDRPSYNKPVNDIPSYGSKPTYDERPAYNKPSIERPIYDKPYEKPSHDTGYAQTPSYDKPSYDQGPAYEKPSYGQKPSYDKPSYDSPAYDKPSYDQKPSYDKPLYGQKPSYGSNNDKPSYGQPPFDNNRPDGELGPESDFGGYKNSKVNQTGYNADKPNIKPVYEYELEKPSNVPSYIVRPSGEVITSRPVTVGSYGREPPVSYKACFRRVLAGKRALRSFVRKVIPCERLEDCRRECAEQKRFHCESFNYRLDPSFRGKGLCEMMTKPIEAFDIRRDFVEDKDYDFYELDRNSLEPHCPETLRGPGLLHSGFLSSKPHMER